MSWINSISPKVSYAVVAMLVACLLPFVFALLAKIAGGFNVKTDNVNPREFFAKTTGLSARLNAAQNNSFESLPIFLASVLVAMYCFVPQNIINQMAWLYVVLRVVYGVAYALNMPTFRSTVWGLSLLCPLSLFYFSIRLVS